MKLAYAVMLAAVSLPVWADGRDVRPVPNEIMTIKNDIPTLPGQQLTSGLDRIHAAKPIIVDSVHAAQSKLIGSFHSAKGATTEPLHSAKSNVGSALHSSATQISLQKHSAFSHVHTGIGTSLSRIHHALPDHGSMPYRPPLPQFATPSVPGTR